MRARTLVPVLAVAAVAIAGVAFEGGTLVAHVLDWRYGRTLPAPRYPHPADAAEANRQDLDYLLALPSVERSFTPQTQVAFEGRVAALRARAESLDAAALFLGVAQALAQAGNAHTRIDPAQWRERLNSAPVRFAWFPEGLFVVRATAPWRSLLGARVLAIDGRDPAALARDAAEFVGGTPEHARVTSPLVLESPQALHVLHADASDAHLLLRVADSRGAESAVQVAAVAPSDAPRAQRPGRLLSSAVLPGEKAGEWATLLADGAQPPSLAAPLETHYSTVLDEGRTLYLHLWRVSRDFDPEVGRAVATALGPAGAAPWRRIILDLRFNDGGEYPVVYRAIRALPGRLAPDGRLVILTDNTTFSGAIITTALAKHFAGPRATVMGEPAGDRLAFWAEGGVVRLPNSGLRVDISTGYHDWARGCREMRCYWPNILLGVAVGSIEPDVPVAWRFSDFRRGIDTVLQRALE